MTTTPIASMYLPPFIVHISDIKELKLELNPITIKLKLELMQIKYPRTKNWYRDPPPRHCYRMLRVICCRKEVALQNNPDLLQYQGSIPIPTTYTIVNSDVCYGTLNLQSAWIPPYADTIHPFERLTYLPSTITTSFVDSIDALHNHKSIFPL